MHAPRTHGRAPCLQQDLGGVHFFAETENLLERRCECLHVLLFCCRICARSGKRGRVSEEKMRAALGWTGHAKEGAREEKERMQAGLDR